LPELNFGKLRGRVLLICDYDSSLLHALSEILDHIGLAERVLIRKKDGHEWQDGTTRVLNLPLSAFRELSYLSPSRLTSFMSVITYLVLSVVVGTVTVLWYKLDKIVGIFAFPQGLAATLIGQFTRREVAVLTDGGDIDVFLAEPLIRPLLLYSLRKAHAVAALNETKAKRLVSQGVTTSICATFGVNTSRFEYTPFEKKEKCLILFVGRLCVEKRIDVLLKACAILHKRGVIFQLLLVGDGPLRDLIPQEAACMDIADVTTVKGYVPHSEVQQFFRRSAIFVLPSIREGVSVALLEAMSSGCLCVVSDIPDNREIVRHMHTGITFRLDDHEDLAARLEWATSEYSAPSSITQNARNLVERQYSLQAVGEKLATILSSLDKVAEEDLRERHLDAGAMRSS
jgi:glycosyltransferase involved in cell wall biosynthesis